MFAPYISTVQGGAFGQVVPALAELFSLSQTCQRERTLCDSSQDLPTFPAAYWYDATSQNIPAGWDENALHTPQLVCIVAAIMAVKHNANAFSAAI